MHQVNRMGSGLLQQKVTTKNVVPGPLDQLPGTWLFWLDCTID